MGRSLVNPFFWLAVLAVVLWIADRILLWCELRGWITYRRMPRVRHAFGNAALGIDALLQPERRHVIELKQGAEVHKEEDDEAGGNGRRRISDDDPADATRKPDRSSDGGGPRREDVPPAFRRD
jgi:hypothetical protein